LIIVIGADNLDSKVPCKRELNSLIDILSKRNAKLILYDCSIQKKNINKFLLKNLSNCDVVTARDTISFENLRKYKEKNLYYIPDPAFAIEPTKIDFGLLNDSTYVGLNLSNTVTGPKGTDRYSLIINSYHKLIEYITNTLKMKVILIPHVMNNADLSVLADLYIKYKETRQVFLIENEGLSSNELKYIISKCRYFVGARTHSTIAAYASCVPTLVLGYSIKSIGIAKDLFSTDKNYVILSSELKNSDTLLNGFKWLIENEISIRESLLNTMDEYSKSAWKFYDIVKNILK
jgi:polysaccharide pyruvyl transferase WcaK-like protein